MPKFNDYKECLPFLAQCVKPLHNGLDDYLMVYFPHLPEGSWKSHNGCFYLNRLGMSKMLQGILTTEIAASFMIMCGTGLSHEKGFMPIGEATEVLAKSLTEHQLNKHWPI